MYASTKCVLYGMFQKNVIYFCGHNFYVKIEVYMASYIICFYILQEFLKSIKIQKIMIILMMRDYNNYMLYIHV